MENSIALRPFHPLLPPLDPLPNFLQLFAPRPLWLHAAIFSTELRQYRFARVFVYEALSYTHGHLGI